MNLSKEDQEVAKLDSKLAQVLRSTKVSAGFMVPIHDQLRMKYRWYYKWHLNPLSSVANIGLAFLFAGAVAFFITSIILSQSYRIIKAASSQTWGATHGWQEWSLVGLTVNGNNELEPTQDSTQPSADFIFNAPDGEVVDWLSYYDEENSDSSGILKEFSTDKIIYSDRIEELSNSNTLYIKITFPAETEKNATLNSFTLNYSRIPAPPDNLSFEFNDGLFGSSQVLTAGSFMDFDGDIHSASQWQITDQSGQYQKPKFDSGTVSDKDPEKLTSIKLPEPLTAGNFYFRVRYQDSTGAWGLWSEECAFSITEEPKDNPSLIDEITNDKTDTKIEVLGGKEAVLNPNELIDKRTETTKTIDNKNGTNTLESYTGIIHYKEDYKDDSPTAWKDINPNHSIDTPEYVLFDALPSTVKVFKDKIGYEIESRKTGDKYTVQLQDVDGNPKLSRSSSTNGLVAWADINTAGNSAQKTENSGIAKWLVPVALADEPQVTDDSGNLKFEFDISEYGVRLWKTITGPDAPKNFKWSVTKSEGAKDTATDDLRFRDKPDAFEVVSAETKEADTTKPIEIDATRVSGTENSFVWAESAPKSDLKIDTDVVYNPDPDAEVTSVDGKSGNSVSPLNWTTCRTAAAGTFSSDADQTAIITQPWKMTSEDSCQITRGFYLFDTHLIPSGSTISSATLSIYGYQIFDNSNIDHDINIYSSSPASNTAIVNADYDQVGSTAFSTAIPVDSWSTSGYNNFALNVDGKANIAMGTGAVSKFSARNANYDVSGSIPADSGGVNPQSESIQGYYAEYTGTDHDPKLSVTYTASSISISGTVYTSEAKGTNVVSNGTTIGLSINGAAKSTTTTTDGAFTFTGKSVASNNTLTIFIDDNASYEGTLVTQAADSISNISGLEMYTNKVVLRHETAGPMTNALLKTADNTDDDIHYTNPSGDAITFDTGYELWIDASKTYTPGAAVNADDIDVNGTFVPSSNAVTLTGSWDSTGGTFTNTSSTVTFTSTSAETITSDTEIFNNLTFNGSGGVWTAQDALTTAASSVLTITAGSFDLANQNFTIGAGSTFSNNDTLKLIGNTQTISNLTIDPDSGTTEYYGTGNYTGLKAGSTYYDLKINGSGATYTLNAPLTVNDNVTLANGQLASGDQTISVGGSWTVTSGTFAAGSGTVTFAGGGTVTPNGQSFNNVTFNTTVPALVTSDLQNYWAMNEASGTATVDDSVGSNDGTSTSTTNVGTGVYGNARTFSNQDVAAGDTPALTNFTISTWFKLNSTATQQALLQKDNATATREFALNADAPNSLMRFYGFTTNDTTYYRFDASVNFDTNWHNVMVTRTGTTVKIYYDGVDTNATLGEGTVANMQNTAAPLWMGKRNYVTAPLALSGSMDDVRIYTRVLNAAEIARVSGAWSLSGDLTVGGNLTMTNGTLTAGNNNVSTVSYIQNGGNLNAPTPAGGKKMTVSDDWTNSAGAFVHNSGKVAFTGNPYIQGSTIFYDADFVTQDKTVTVKSGTTQTFSGTLNVQGAAGHLVTFTSNDTSAYTFSVATAPTISYADVSYMTGSGAGSPFCAAYSQSTSSNNTDVSVNAGAACFISISGTYDGASGSIKVAVNGTLSGRSVSNAASWTITSVEIPATGASVVVFVDGASPATDQATTVTKYSGSGNITGVTLTKGAVTIGSNQNQSISNTEFNSYDSVDDADILFTLSGTALTVNGDLTILASNTYSPDGDTTVLNSWTNNGTYTHNSHTVTFNGSTAGKTIKTNGSPFYNLSMAAAGDGSPQTAGPRNPSAWDQEARTNGYVWSNGQSTYAYDGSSATCAGAQGFGVYTNSVCNYLKVKGFGFTIPTGSTITGVKIETYRYQNNVNSNYIYSVTDFAIQLLAGGALTGDNLSQGTSWIEHNEGPDYVTFGGTGNTWGASLSAETVNNSGFGVAIAPNVATTNYGTAVVDHVRITVYYNNPMASWALQDGMTVDNNLNVSAGTLTAGNNDMVAGNYIQSGGVLSAPTSANGKKLTVNGGWNKSGGTFTHNSGKVEFAGDALIEGSTDSFYDVDFVTQDKTVTIANGTTQTFQGTLKIQGAASHLVTFTSDTTSNYNIIATATPDVSYADISYMNASGSGTPFCAAYSTSTNGNNNTGISVNSGATCFLTVSGTSDGETGNVSIIVGGALTNRTTANGATWTVTSVPIPTAGQGVVAFVDGAASGDWATAATIYDSSGDITGITLNKGAVTIGSDDHQTISNTNFGGYDAVDDGDILFTLSDATLKVVGDLNILALNTYAPDGDTEVLGSWNNSGTFTHNNHTVTFSSGTGKTMTTNGSPFYNITITGEGYSDVTSTNLPGTAENYDDGGDYAWTDVDNAKSKTDSGVMAHSNTNNATIGTYTSQMLKLTNYGFNVPLGATIDGVELHVVRSQGIKLTDDNTIQLIGGGAAGDNKGTADNWTVTDVTYGNSSDAWNAGLSAGIVNSPSFGAEIKADFTNNPPMSSTVDAYVDYGEITVYYTMPSGDWTLQDALTATNNLTISSGSLASGNNNITAGNVIQSGGIFTAPSSSATTGLIVNGGWNYSGGTFTHNNGTVEFAGDALIQGETSFFNFTADTAGKTLTFNGGETKTIEGTWTIKGSEGNRITLASSDTNNWTIDPTNAVVDFATVDRSVNIGTSFCATHSSGTNTTDWTFSESATCGSTIEFSSATANGSENTTSLNVAVTLNTVSASDASVHYSISGGTATGGGVDYTLASGTATITAGNLTANLPVTIIDDTLDEENETIQITLTNPTNAALGANTVYTYTINDNDNPPTIYFSSASGLGAENSSPVSIPVSLSQASSKEIAVSYSVTGGTATGGGTDFTLSSGTLTISAGSTSGNILLTVISDLLDETNETVLITLSNPVNATLSTPSLFTYTIADDDAAPTVTLSQNHSTISENGGASTVSATLSSVSGKNVTVFLSFAGTATNNTDYSRSGATISIPAGSLTGSIVLTALDDSLDEYDEVITTDIDSLTNATEAGIAQTSTTITDNDNPPAIAFSSSGSSTPENVSTANIQVSLSSISAKDVSVSYSAIGGTATNGGVDYTLQNGQITIPAGELSANISLAIINDLLDEADETVIVSLIEPINSIIGGISEYSLTITDDDNTPTLSFSATSGSGTEDSGSRSIEISLSALSGRAVTAVIGLSGTAILGSDYTMSSVNVTIPAGSRATSISLGIINDTSPESDETAILALSSISNALSGQPVYTFTIIDNDEVAPLPTYIIAATAGPNGSINPSGTVTLFEGEGITFQMTPNLGYRVAKVTVDGDNMGDVSSYSLDNISRNHTIYAEFTILTFTVQAISSDSGGQVSIEKNIYNYGESAFMQTTVNPGFQIASISDNGELKPITGNTYQIDAIDTDHTIIVSFSLAYYTLAILKSGDGEGNLSQSTQTVTYFSNVDIFAAPAESSNFTGWSGDRISSDNHLVLTDFTGNMTVAANFELKVFAITVLDNGHGTLSPNGVVLVKYGRDITFTTLPDVGYYSFDIIVDGHSNGQIDSYTFANVLSDHAIKPVFETYQYTITIITDGPGSASSSASVVPYGGEVKIALSPQQNFVVSELYDNGIRQPETTEYLIRNIRENHQIRVVFADQPKPPLVSKLAINGPSAEYEFGLPAIIPISWVYEGAEVQKFRLSYQTNTADFSIARDLIPGSDRSTNFELNLDRCPFIEGRSALRIEALDAAGQVLAADIVSGTFELPEIKVVVDKSNLKNGTIELRTRGEYQLRAAVLSTDSSVNYSKDAMISWQADKKAGEISSDGLFKAGYNQGLHTDAISAIGSYCGKKSLSSVSLRIEQSDAPLPVESIINSSTSAGTATVTAIAIAGGGISNVLTTMSLSEFLKSLLLPFLSIGARKKRRGKWGRVLEEGTGLPISMAKITLYKIDDDGITKKIAATTYSDKEGYYGFVAGIGRYTIGVAKDLYTMMNFPGYYKPGTVLTVSSESQSLIVPSIVMALNEQSLQNRFRFLKAYTVWEKIFSVFAFALLLFSTYISVTNLIHYPHNATAIVIASINLLVWAVNIYSFTRVSPWGEVLDRNNLAPLPLSLVRILDKSGTKLIRTAITNEKGKFSALMPKGNYKVIVSKAGYVQPEAVEIKRSDKLNLINKKIMIERKQQ